MEQCNVGAATGARTLFSHWAIYLTRTHFGTARVGPRLRNRERGRALCAGMGGAIQVTRDFVPLASGEPAPYVHASNAAGVVAHKVPSGATGWTACHDILIVGQDRNWLRELLLGLLTASLA